MTVQHLDQLKALGKKLKYDVKESGLARAGIFLDIWNSIERRLEEENFDPLSIRTRHKMSDLRLCDRLVDIGRCYLPDDTRLPNERDPAEQWLSIGAAWGSFMGQMLLLRMQIEAGRTAYDPRWLQAFRQWQTAEEQSDLLWKEQKKCFSKMGSVAIELGLQAAVGTHDAALAEEVLKAMQAASVDDLRLTGLQWQAEGLLPQNQIPSGPQRQILTTITPGNGDKENQTLERFRPLLYPLPLQVWPDSPSWAAHLRREYPWMSGVMETLEQEWALHRVTGQTVLKFRPLLLVGSPGLGKSRFVRSLGDALGLHTAFMTMAGMSDNMMLKGTARGWSSARAGYLVEFMLEHRVANPLVCLDEIEKIGMGQNNGRLWETLLTMLESSTASRVTDEFLLGSVDYAACNWIATANDIKDLPEPLRSRFTIIRVGEPAGKDFEPIFTNILDDIARDLGTESWALPSLNPQITYELRQKFQRKPSSLRALNVVTRKLLQLEAKAQIEDDGAMRRLQ